MRFCDGHWGTLAHEVAETGLPTLGLSNDSAVELLRTSTEFGDPMMIAYYVVLDNLAREGGIGVLLATGCPVCLADQAHVEACQDDNCIFTYKEWIIRAVEQLAEETQ